MALWASGCASEPGVSANDRAPEQLTFAPETGDDGQGQATAAAGSSPSSAVHDPSLPGGYAGSIERKAFSGSTVISAIGADSDHPGCVIFHPSGAELDRSGEQHPVVVYGTGTSADVTDYEVAMEHLASHGFVAVITDTTDIDDWGITDTLNPINWTPLDKKPNGRFNMDGRWMGQCLDFARALNAGTGDVRYDALEGHVSQTKACAGGHSAGGSGAILLGQREDVQCIFPMMPGFHFEAADLDVDTEVCAFNLCLDVAKPFDQGTRIFERSKYFPGFDSSSPSKVNPNVTMLLMSAEKDPAQRWDVEYVWESTPEGMDALWIQHKDYVHDCHGYEWNEEQGYVDGLDGCRDFDDFRGPITALLRAKLMDDHTHERWYKGESAIVEIDKSAWQFAKRRGQSGFFSD
jgi:hypothetical protein